MDKIKRYFFMVEASKNAQSFEHEDGSYVLYADHLKAVNDFNQFIKKQEETIKDLKEQIWNMNWEICCSPKEKIANNPEEELTVEIPPLKKGEKITIIYG